jgi:hypothetical protein
MQLVRRRRSGVNAAPRGARDLSRFIAVGSEDKMIFATAF